MDKAPERIYINQPGKDHGYDDDFPPAGDNTFHITQRYTDDVEYVRADRVKELKKDE